jgi:nucleoside-diphosphate-sugar epimerase
VDSKAISKHTKIVIYGGNGFVGTRVAEHLAALDTCTVCLSRSGHKPIHLKDEPWSTSVRWCKGDASNADEKLLARADVVICLVGSPPLPTFSKQSFEDQVFMNGTTCVNAIESAQRAGVKRIVLLGARIPFLMDSDRFGYAKGKKMAVQAAEKFAETSEQHSAIVLHPGVIYGKRHLASGKTVPLDWFLGPMATFMPWQFISVEAVAQRIAHAATEDEPYQGKFTLISSSKIKLS